MAAKENITCLKCELNFGREVYMLACMHNFCGACINTMKQDDETTCYLCTTTSNKDDVIRNTFIEKIMSFQMLIDDDQKNIISCDICDPAIETNVAENYCVECSQYLCDKCSKSHSRTKTTSTHNIVERLKVDKTDIKNQIPKCEKHDQDLTIYCKEYDILICALCHEMSHTDHEKDEDVKPIFEQTKLTVKQKIDYINQLIQSQQLQQKQNEKKEFMLIDKVNAMRADIDARAKQLKESINEMRSKFVHKLEAYKIEYIKSIFNKSNELNKYILALNQMKSYLQVVVDNGSNFDIFNLKKEVDKNKWIEKQKPRDMANLEISYVPGKFNETLLDCSQLFGYFKDSKNFALQNIVTRSSCLVGNDLYIMNKSFNYVDVYDIHTSFKSKINLPSIRFKLHYTNKKIELFVVRNQLFLAILIFEGHYSKFERSFYKYDSIENNFENLNIENIMDKELINYKYILQNYNEPFFYQLNDKRRIEFSFEKEAFSISLLDKDRKFIKSITKNSSKDITTCTDGEKYILLLERSSNQITILSTELQPIQQFSIPDVINISYDKENFKFMVVTTKEIQYLNFI